MQDQEIGKRHCEGLEPSRIRICRGSTPLTTPSQQVRQKAPFYTTDVVSASLQVLNSILEEQFLGKIEKCQNVINFNGDYVI